MPIIEAECNITAVSSMAANASKRTLLAHQYLQGAAAFAKLSATLQSQTSSALHVAYVAGAIFLSVAALEAAVNAILIDDPDWKNTKNFHLLDKCDHVLKKHDKRQKKLARGNPVCQRVTVIITLRNELVHYKPEWDDNLNAHEQVRKKFESVIPRKLLPSDFPSDYMISDFALMAVEWCGDFARDFFARLDMLEEGTMWDISQIKAHRDVDHD